MDPRDPDYIETSYTAEEFDNLKSLHDDEEWRERKNETLFEQ